VQLAEEPSFRNRLHVNAAESAAKYLAASDLYLSLNFELDRISEEASVSLCATLNKVLNEPNLRSHLARLARERACGWQTIEEVTDAYLAVYAR
jgi:hypothetical protein